MNERHFIMNGSIIPRNQGDPFRVLFLEFLKTFDASDIRSRSAALQQIARQLEHLESSAENESIFLHWSGIFSTFSTAAVISAFGVLNPIAGILVSGTAAISAAGIIGSAIAHKRERSPIIDKLKKTRLAIQSDSYLNWACLWQYVGDEDFFLCLQCASGGYLLDDKLVRNDGKNPMAVAVDEYAKLIGATREYVVGQLSLLKKTSIPSLPLTERSHQTTITSPSLPLDATPSLPLDATERSHQTTITSSGKYTPTFEIDIVGELTKMITNTLIIGAPGAGKGVILSNALRALKVKYPGRKIFVIDPKADSDEAGYFEGVADRYEAYPCERLSASEIVRWIKWCIEDYHSYAEMNGGCLLIIDECVTIGGAFVEMQDNYLKTQMSRIASLGDKQKKNVWILSQSPFVGDFGIGKGMISQMSVVALIREPGIVDLWSGSGVKIPKPSPEELIDLINKSPRKRAIYLQRTGRWYSMPELPIHAYYDRDLDKKLSPASVPSDSLTHSERRSLKNAQANKVSTAQSMVDLLDKTIETTIEGFIVNVLQQESRLGELKPAIIKAIKECDRFDLLEKFGITDERI